MTELPYPLPKVGKNLDSNIWPLGFQARYCGAPSGVLIAACSGILQTHC